MIMIKEQEIERFLKRMAKIYIANNFSINKDIIYSELSRINNGSYIPSIDLFEVKRKLRKNFDIIDSNSYFDWINVIPNGNYKQFDKKIVNSNKIYVALPTDINEIYSVVNNIWKFLIDNKIESQSKISAFLRTDALVIRVCQKKDLIKIVEFINTLVYNKRVQPNPFLFHCKNVALAKDSAVISYNGVLAKIISSYINKFGSNLSNINVDTFRQYVSNEVKENSNIEYQILLGILENTISINTFTNFTKHQRKEEKVKKDEDNVEILDAIIHKLRLYYDREEIKNLVEQYIQQGNINYFTRKSNIRQNVSKNFDRKSFESTFYDLVWKKLYNASFETYDKYGLEQVISALDKLLKKEDYSYFTNQNNVRYELEDICSYKFLLETINEKLYKNGKVCNLKNLIELIVLDIEKNYGDIKAK